MSATAPVVEVPKKVEIRRGEGNPLVSFRAPQNLRRADIEKGHFTTRREDVSNDLSAISIYPDNFRYHPNRTLEIDIKMWEDFDDQRSFASYTKLTGRDGYQVAMAKDFDVDHSVARVWRPDATGRLTFGGKSINTMVLMWCTAKEFDRVQNERLKWSNDVQKHAQETQAALVEKLGQAGIQARVEASFAEPETSGPSQS